MRRSLGWISAVRAAKLGDTVNQGPHPHVASNVLGGLKVNDVREDIIYKNGDVHYQNMAER
jgi:hypothetical protein